MSEAVQRESMPKELSAAWMTFIRFCEKVGFGEIAVLKIQNGVPMMAEQVTKKIKFS